LSPIEVLIAAFAGYLIDERGLAAGTVEGYCAHARRFMSGLPGVMDVAGVRASEVIEAVRMRVSPTWCVAVR
jgi:hypothetical protein